MKITQLFLGPIPITDQLPYPIIFLIPLLLVLLEISIQVQHKIEHELLIIFMHLLLLTIELSSIDIQEQIFRLISDVHLFLEVLTIYLHREVELLIKCVLECPEPRVEDDASEVTNNRFFFFHLDLLVVLYLCAVEELLDEAFLRVEDGVETSLILALIDEGRSRGDWILVFFEEFLAEGEALAKSLNDHNVDL